MSRRLDDIRGESLADRKPASNRSPPAPWRAKEQSQSSRSSRLANAAFARILARASPGALVVVVGIVAALFALMALNAYRAVERELSDAVMLLAFCALAIFLATRLFMQRHWAEADRRARAELERRVAERTEQLRALNRELESSSYPVSHDLRVPLRAIDGFARMVEEDHAALLDDEGRRLLAVVRQSAAQMSRLIDELLRFSHLGQQALAVVPLDMEALAREALAQVSGTFPSACIELYPLPPATGDRTLLGQVWVNLIGNALKYSAQRDHPAVKIGARRSGRETVYWVRDNGVGFDMRHYNKLFGVFPRLHDAGQFEGTGVGLAIVQRIVTRHGGRVWAEGKSGEGACFSFALPRLP